MAKKPSANSLAIREATLREQEIKLEEMRKKIEGDKEDLDKREETLKEEKKRSEEIIEEYKKTYDALKEKKAKLESEYE